jgi:hypothetical protein
MSERIQPLVIGETLTINTYEYGIITGELVKRTDNILIIDDGIEEYKIIY